jgi:hypothetical protein
MILLYYKILLWHLPKLVEAAGCPKLLLAKENGFAGCAAGFENKLAVDVGAPKAGAGLAVPNPVFPPNKVKGLVAIVVLVGVLPKLPKGVAEVAGVVSGFCPKRP